ncbi:MAG TPA: ATP-binding protein [Anaeromyxobacteraceae bacterium]|nr:ATP-binding protein [Anaeromyxobacteraceae bacterium]
MEARSLPASAAPASGVEPASLLLVDDDEHVRRALKRVLKRSGCRLLDAPDAEEALRTLAREPVQVVVSDYRMPGMSGVEFLRVVKERWPGIQRVLLTGQADTAAIEEAVNQSEIFRFIWKPWDDAHLIVTVQSAVDQYRLSEENARLHALVSERNVELERVNRDLDSKLEARSRALLRAADEWRACFDAIGDPLAILRGGCEVLRANSAFARAAGVALNDLPGLACSGGAFGSIPCMHGTPDVGTPWEHEAVRDDRTWALRAFPIGENGTVVVYKDVTEERNVQRRLLHTEKMAAVGQLAGGVAHEINNPLGGILAFAQIMSREERSASDLESLRLIGDAAIRAKRIVESLLRFSRRPQQDEKGPFDLAKVADDALFLLQPQFKGSKVEIVRDLSPALGWGNANLVQQVAVNLVVNALQAIGGRGGRIVVAASHAGAVVRLTVTDDGPGIPPGIADRVFDPFFTTKPEGQGTGLGLSICYRIAEEHGGSIRHEPSPGGGASFLLEIPAAPQQP